jgi:hypothetical protein
LRNFDPLDQKAVTALSGLGLAETLALFQFQRLQLWGRRPVSSQAQLTAATSSGPGIINPQSRRPVPYERYIGEVPATFEKDGKECRAPREGSVPQHRLARLGLGWAVGSNVDLPRFRGRLRRRDRRAGQMVFYPRRRDIGHQRARRHRHPDRKGRDDRDAAGQLLSTGKGRWPPLPPTHFEVLLPSGQTGWVPVNAFACALTTRRGRRPCRQHAWPTQYPSRAAQTELSSNC